MAYQICFDLYESASQQFLSSVIQNLRTVGTPIPAVPGSTNTGTVPTADKDRWAAGDNKDSLKALCFFDVHKGQQTVWLIQREFKINPFTALFLVAHLLYVKAFN